MNIKCCRFLSGFFIVSLLVFGSCMMPELSPELYVSTLNIENAGVVNINNTEEVNIYGEEYLRISKPPQIVYIYR